jgi:hypothetical protein
MVYARHMYVFSKVIILEYVDKSYLNYITKVSINFNHKLVYQDGITASELAPDW